MQAACLQVTRNCWLRVACSEEPTCWETLSKQRLECNSSRCGMALWQMKTLIRDGRVSILFFFNPCPEASAIQPCLCLRGEKFPVSLCNKNPPPFSFLFSPSFYLFFFVLFNFFFLLQSQQTNNKGPPQSGTLKLN